MNTDPPRAPAVYLESIAAPRQAPAASHQVPRRDSIAWTTKARPSAQNRRSGASPDSSRTRTPSEVPRRARSAPATSCNDLELLEAAAGPTIDHRSFEVICIREKELAVELEGAPPVAPAALQHLHLRESATIPFVDSRRARMMRLHTGRFNALRQGEKVPCADAEVPPLLGAERCERLHRSPSPIDPLVDGALNVHLIGAPARANTGSCDEPASVDLEDLHVFAAG